MKKSNANEKSRGVVLFAFNTDDIDYIAIAKQAARLINHTLSLPVTLITDKEHTNNVFDSIITVEHQHKNFKNAEQSQWRNADRYNAYALSPYDETLLIDSDYLMLDKSLLKMFDVTVDYRLQHNNIILDDASNFIMGMTSLPYVWATVVLFKKTSKSKMLFDLVGRIQRNYQYYRLLYNIRETNFRNDYAFAIANSIINGYALSTDQSIPWSMVSVDEPIKSIELHKDFLLIRNENRAQLLPKQNLHVMYKPYLLSQSFRELVDDLCQN